jgi:cytidylate kinase
MTVVTISRFTHSGGETLARCLAEKLGIPSISREVLKEVASQFGISEPLLREQLERTQGLIHGPSPERRVYLAALQLALAEKAQQGPFIYHGHAGHLLLKGLPHILKVGIIASLQFRAQKLMKKENINLEEAIKSIKQSDESRIKWVRFLYDVYWLDPSLYDLVINIEYVSLETACELIVCTLRQEQFKEKPENKALIEDFVLASRVKVQLATHERTKGLELEVAAEKGIVKISGKILTGGIFSRGKQTTKNDLIEVAQKIPGVKQVLIGLEEFPVPLE